MKCSPTELLIEGDKDIASVSGDQTTSAPAAHACKVVCDVYAHLYILWAPEEDIRCLPLPLSALLS